MTTTVSLKKFNKEEKSDLLKSVDHSIRFAYDSGFQAGLVAKDKTPSFEYQRGVNAALDQVQFAYQVSTSEEVKKALYAVIRQIRELTFDADHSMACPPRQIGG